MEEKEFEKKKKSKKGLIITLIAVAVIVVAVLVFYFVIFKSPKFAFNQCIDKMFATSTLENFETEKAKIGLQLELDSDNDTIDEINDVLKNCKLDFETQVDIKNKQEIINLSLDYKKDNAITVQEYYDDGNAYIYLDEIFDKYIEVDLEDANIEKLFEGMSKVQLKSNKANKILANEIKSSIAKQKFSKNSETIKINKEEVKVTKNVLTLNEKDTLTIIKDICKKLTSNKEFLNCFEESPKDEIKEIAEKADKYLENKNYNTKNKITIAIYTKGLLNEFAGIEFEIYSADEEETVKIEVIKNKENEYSFEFVSEKETSYSYSKNNGTELKGTIKIDKTKEEKDEETGKIELNIETEELKATAKIDYEIELNKKIDNVKVKNSVKLEKITQTEQQKILEKLSERPLIGDIISNLVSTKQKITNKVSDVADKTKSMAEKEQLTEYVIQQDSIYTGEVDLEAVKSTVMLHTEIFKGAEWVDLNQKDKLKVTGISGTIFIVDKNGEITTEEISNNQASNNELYSGYYKVTYTVPADFKYKEDWSSNSYKYYEKGDYYTNGIRAELELSSYDTEQEIKNDIKEEYEFEKQYSEDVTISEVKSIDVNGKKFNYQTISYKYYGDAVQNAYVWYDLGDRNMFEITFKASNEEITEDIMKQFLNITATKID